MAPLNRKRPGGMPGQREMKAHVKSLSKWCARLAVSLGLIAGIAYFVPLAEVAAAIRTANLAYILAGWLLFFLGFYLGAWSLRILTARLDVAIGTWAIFEVNLVTQFYQLFLPGGFVTGGLIRWSKITRHDNKPAEVLAAILFNRMLEVWSLAFLALGFWLLEGPALRQPVIGATLIALFAGLCLLYAVAVSRRAFALFEGLIARLPAALDRLKPHLLKLSGSLARFNGFGPGGHATILALAVLRNLVRIVSLVCLAHAIGLPVADITLGWVRSFTQLVNLLPISYAGLGVREVSLLVLLEPYGASKSAIVSLSMLWFSALLLTALLGGLLEARRLFRKARGSAASAAAVAGKRDRVS